MTASPRLAGRRGGTRAASPRLSVVVAGDGPPGDVAASVASALDQSEADLEVVVAARSREWTEALAAAGDERLRWLEARGESFAELAAEGLERSRAAIVQVLPSGERLAPHAAAAGLLALERRPEAGAALARAERIDATGRPALSPESERATDPLERAPGGVEALLVALLGRRHVAAGGVLLRRGALARAGGVDPLYRSREAALRDLWLRLLVRAEAVLLPERIARVPEGAYGPGPEAEEALVRIEALRRLGVEPFLRALAVSDPDGAAEERCGRATARIALAGRLLGAELSGVLFLVERLLREAAAEGLGPSPTLAERLERSGLLPPRVGDASWAEWPPADAGPSGDLALDRLRLLRRALAAVERDGRAERRSSALLGAAASGCEGWADLAAASEVAAPAALAELTESLAERVARLEELSGRVHWKLRLTARVAAAGRRLLGRTGAPPRGGAGEAR